MGKRKPTEVWETDAFGSRGFPSVDHQRRYHEILQRWGVPEHSSCFTSHDIWVSVVYDDFADAERLAREYSENRRQRGAH